MPEKAIPLESLRTIHAGLSNKSRVRVRESANDACLDLWKLSNEGMGRDSSEMASQGDTSKGTPRQTGRRGEGDGE